MDACNARLWHFFYFTGGFMAQYDGSIKINTQINVKSAEAQLGALEVSISKSANKIADLRSKLDSLKTAQIPTQEYSEIAAQIEKAQHSLDGLLEKQAQMQAEGKTSGTSWERISAKIAETRSELSYAKGELQALVDEGKAFTVGDPAQEERLTQHLQAEEARLASMAQKRDLLNSKVQAAMEEEQRLASIKENATVTDQRLVDLLEQRRQLLVQIKDLEKAGVTEGYAEYDNALADLSDVQGHINGIRDMRDAAAQARASYVGLGETVRQTGRIMARGLVDIPIAAVKAGVRGLVSAFQKLGGVVKNVAVNTFHKLGSAIKTSLSKAGSLIGNVVSKMRLLGSTAKKSFGTVNKSAKKTGGLMGTIASRFKGIALSLLLFNWVTKAFNGAVKAIKDGFSNLYKDNEKFKTSVDNLRASVLTLKNAFAAAFRPLVDIAIPYIQMAADKLTELLTNVGQFTAAITGQATYTKAIKQTADAFKDAKKAAEGYLSPLDEINKFSSKKDDEEEQTGIMFEEVPIEQKFKDMAEKVKDVFADLFAPIKEAWDKEGDFVIDSWKYALGEIKKLLGDIGRDFLEVWNQPKTITILQDILHIFGDIGLVVGTLAAKFREAWNANDVGLHILENILDIFAVIIHNIREAADYTVEWAKAIDFTPLLQGVERLTASLVPFFDFLSGTLADFYTQFLLPLASWTLSEEGIPRLLNVLADFMESVNWEGLRTALKELYSALEPYAEAIGTGLIDFIERMKEYGVDFLNFLPEHIHTAADALRNGDLPTAFEEFGTICGEAVKNAFSFIKETIESINWGEIGTLIASFVNGIDWNGVSQAFFGSISSAINAAIDLAYGFVTTFDFSEFGASVGKSLSDAFLDMDFERVGETLGTLITGIFQMVIDFCGNFDWVELGEKISDGINGFFKTFDGAKFAESATAVLSGLLDTLIATVSTIDWADIWRDIIDFLTNVNWVELIGKLIIAAGELIAGIVVGLIQAIAETDWGKVWNDIVNAFKEFFGIHSPSTLFQEFGTFLIQGLIDGINSLIENVTQIWQSMKETAAEIWNTVKENLSETWDNISATAKEKWDSIKQNLSETWENLKTDAKEKWESIKESMRQNVENMKTKAGELGDKISSLKEKTRSAFDSMKDKIASASDSMKDKLDGFIDKVKAAIDAVKDFLNSGWEKVKSGFSGGGNSGESYSARSYSMRSASSPYAAIPAIAKLVDVPIPGYATGQVIPRRMKQHLAILGDNTRETEVVSPLSTIEQAVTNAMVKAGVIGSSNNGGNTYNVKAIANGNVIFDMIIEEGKTRMMSSGRNPFDLGTT